VNDVYLLSPDVMGADTLDGDDPAPKAKTQQLGDTA